MADADDPLARFRTPVSEDAPAGEDLTYDEAYLRIREEVDRMGTVSVHIDHEGGGGGGGAEVDFDEIATEARTLLADRTRDLQLAAYLTIALSRSRGAAGVAEGLATVLALAESFGDAVHPVKPVRRRNALQFVSDRLKDWLADRPFGPAEAEALEAAAATAEGLQTWATEAMGENAPALSGLRQSIDEALKRATRAARTAEAQVAATAAPTPAAPAGAGADGPLALSSVSDARRVVSRVCAFLREQDPSSPVPYRLARAMAWGALRAEPPSVDGRTQVEAPDANARNQLQSVAAGGNPQAALAAAEEVYGARPLWLDVQRVAAVAAEQAGQPAIAEAVTGLTAELVGRVPGLVGLAFGDGSPFADPATRAWLDGLPAVSGASAPAQTGEDPLAEVLGEARSLAAAGKLDAALRVLQEAPAGNAGGRARLLRGLHVARLCLQGDRPGVAAALLEGLGQDADRRSLDDWEPALALELWRAAHAAWAAAAGSDADKDDALRRAAAAYDRVCRLDPATALSLSGDKKRARG